MHTFVRTYTYPQEFLIFFFSYIPTMHISHTYTHTHTHMHTCKYTHSQAFLTLAKISFFLISVFSSGASAPASFSIFVAAVELAVAAGKFSAGALAGIIEDKTGTTPGGAREIPSRAPMYVCVYVCMCVCMCMQCLICVCVCMYKLPDELYMCKFICSLCADAHISILTYIHVQITHTHLHVCKYLSSHLLCMYVCMYISFFGLSI